MKKLHFSLLIKASREIVWHILFDDETFRDWASIIDEGTYRVGELRKGNTVDFISAAGYGVKSFVEEFALNERLVIRQLADTQDNGAKERDKEWTGGTEIYLLEDSDGATSLTVEIDVPPEQERTFLELMPKALQRVKALAECNDV